MREGAEDAARAVTGLLHVVALGGLVDLGMELLLRASMAIRARVPLLAVARLAPFLPVLHVRAWCRAAIDDDFIIAHGPISTDRPRRYIYRYLYFRGLRRLSLLL